MQLYLKSIDEIVNVITKRIQTIWMHNDFLYNRSSLKRKEENCLKIINAYSKRVIKNKREAEKNAQPQQNHKGRTQGFLDLALQLTKDDLMSDQLLLEHINSLTFAGYHTVSASLHFILLIIGSYTEVQNRIYDELHDVLRGTAEEDITVVQLSKLVYIDAVINEAARLYPVAPVVLRYIEKDVQLQNYTMKAGCDCVVMLHELNRSRIWGPDKDQFRPERWLEPGLLANAKDYTGFGTGRRACLGRSYAMLSLKTTLAHLIRRYKVTADHTKMKITLEINLEPVEGHGISIESR
ncbi:unnamed protein product [Chilo suppressalis]|nr:unnamed protein product [Chilo suppressalis]